MRFLNGSIKIVLYSRLLPLIIASGIPRKLLRLSTIAIKTTAFLDTFIYSLLILNIIGKKKANPKPQINIRGNVTNEI